MHETKQGDFMNVVNIPSKCLKICRSGTFLDLHISESVLKHNHFAASTAGHFIYCQARVLAKGLEGCFCIAKLASFC